MLFALALQLADPAWYVTEKVDLITDRTMAMASIGQGKGRLAIGCTAGSEGKIGVVAVFPDYMAASEVAGVDVRFDKDTPFTVSALFNQHQIQIRSAKSAEAFVAQMRTAHRVVIQTNDYRGKTHTLVFDLPNDSGPIDRVLSTCGPFAES